LIHISDAQWGIRSLAEPFLYTTSDFAEIVFAILGVAAKLEHRRIKERTARGRADAKAKGVKFGRKAKLTPHQQTSSGRRSCQSGHVLLPGYLASLANILWPPNYHAKVT
jgi:DNA invertase Pin-like site-specific DNA recombinase